MKNILLIIFLIYFIFNFHVYSFSNETNSNVNHLLSALQKNLNLNDKQIDQIYPILKTFAIKRQEFMKSLDGDPLINKKNVKATLLAIRKEENKELRKVLTESQMNKLLNKQRMRDSLNKDQIDFYDAYGGEMALTPEGGTLRF